jgi:hypothetical protein
MASKLRPKWQKVSEGFCDPCVRCVPLCAMSYVLTLFPRPYRLQLSAAVPCSHTVHPANHGCTVNDIPLPGNNFIACLIIIHKIRKVLFLYFLCKKIGCWWAIPDVRSFWIGYSPSPRSSYRPVSPQIYEYKRLGNLSSFMFLKWYKESHVNNIYFLKPFFLITHVSHPKYITGCYIYYYVALMKSLLSCHSHFHYPIKPIIYV